jgi:hypothetical protein
MNMMSKRQRELTRFAISFLMANLNDAFEDVDQPEKPTLEELDEIYGEFVNPLPTKTTPACNVDDGDDRFSPHPLNHLDER